MQTQSSWEKVPNVPGFYRRDTAAGMVYRFRAPGETAWTRVPGNPGEMEAKQWRNRYLGADELARLKPTSTKFIDVAETAITNLEAHRRAEGTIKGHRINLAVYLTRLHNVPIQEIDRHKLIALVVRPMEEGEFGRRGVPLSGSTIHNALMTASVAFEFAIDCKPRLIDENPVRRVKAGQSRPSRKSNKRKVILSATQLATLLTHASDSARPIFATLALAGLRLNEALHLEWRMIDFEHRLLWPNGTKNTTSREGSVQLSKQLAKTLAAHKLAQLVAHNDDYVFVSSTGKPYDKRNIQRQLEDTINRIQKIDPTFPTFSPHHLRHTFASHLLAATGGDDALAAAQLRHASPAVTKAIYHHEIEGAQEARRGADAIDASLGAAL